MSDSSPSIAQLVPLVEKLRALLREHPADRPWQAPDSGQALTSLGQDLAQLWPHLAEPGEPLSQDILD
ncbi:MAG: hypothetical protein HY794_14645, partial [Desulfarculus sp.]|nr:hypothetical protein [Desulfarculus sp.]